MVVFKVQDKSCECLFGFLAKKVFFNSFKVAADEYSVNIAVNSQNYIHFLFFYDNIHAIY